MNEERKLSEQISNFLKLLEQVEKDYAWAIQEEAQAENLTQNYLHQLELLPFSYHERAKIAKKLSECRIQRRAMKDTIMLNGPVVEFLETEKGKALIAQLQQVLGKVRKGERIIKERAYTPKVLSQEAFTTGH